MSDEEPKKPLSRSDLLVIRIQKERERREARERRKAEIAAEKILQAKIGKQVKKEIKDREKKREKQYANSTLHRLDQPRLDEIVSEILQGIPLEEACRARLIDLDDVLVMRRRVQLKKPGYVDAWDKHVHNTIEQAEAQHVTKLIKEWLASGSKVELERVKTYLEKTQVRFSPGREKRAEYDSKLMLDALRMVLASMFPTYGLNDGHVNQVFMMVIDKLASIKGEDLVQTTLKLDEALNPAIVKELN